MQPTSDERKEGSGLSSRMFEPTIYFWEGRGSTKKKARFTRKRGLLRTREGEGDPLGRLLITYIFRETGEEEGKARKGVLDQRERALQPEVFFVLIGMGKSLLKENNRKIFKGNWVIKEM